MNKSAPAGNLIHGASSVEARYGDVALLLARLGMASLFIFSGMEKILMYRMFIGFATKGGLPLAEYVSPLVIVSELVGSAMLILGWRMKFAAWCFAAFCLIVGPWFHPFWSSSVPPEKWQDAVDGFFHHMVMVGGFVFAAIHGPGRFSVDSRTKT